MYTKIKQWFINLFTKPKQTPVADRVEPLVDVYGDDLKTGLERNISLLEKGSDSIPKPPPMRYVKDERVIKAPPKKPISSNPLRTDKTQNDTNNLLTQAVVASVILSDTPSTHSASSNNSDYSCSSRSSSSSSSYDSSSTSSDSSSSSSGCD